MFRSCLFLVFVECLVLVYSKGGLQVKRYGIYRVVWPHSGQIHHRSSFRIHIIMAFLYEPKNSNLAKLVIRLQREDIEALTTGDENIDLALNLQLEELRIAETLIADHRVAVDCQLEPDRDRELALALAVTRHEAIAALLTCTGCESLFTRH
jgi:hypothetical protein